QKPRYGGRVLEGEIERDVGADGVNVSLLQIIERQDVAGYRDGADEEEFDLPPTFFVVHHLPQLREALQLRILTHDARRAVHVEHVFRLPPNRLVGRVRVEAKDGELILTGHVGQIAHVGLLNPTQIGVAGRTE